jgi:hypothetical protein
VCVATPSEYFSDIPYVCTETMTQFTYRMLQVIQIHKGDSHTLVHVVLHRLECLHASLCEVNPKPHGLCQHANRKLRLKLARLLSISPLSLFRAAPLSTPLTCLHGSIYPLPKLYCSAHHLRAPDLQLAHIKTNLHAGTDVIGLSLSLSLSLSVPLSYCASPQTKARDWGYDREIHLKAPPLGVV